MKRTFAAVILLAALGALIKLGFKTGPARSDQATLPPPGAIGDSAAGRQTLRTIS